MSAHGPVPPDPGSPLFAAQRQGYVLSALRQQGAVRVRELAAWLRVSEMTVRRDLSALAAKGLLTKVHGGATAREQLRALEPTFAEKSGGQRAAKRAIARLAAGMVAPGQAIGLSGGTTTWLLAQQILGVRDLTVVTNSLPAAGALHDPSRDDRTVVLTGGVRTRSEALVGPAAVRTLTGLHVDTLFLGVYGFHAEAALTTPNMLEAQTDAAFVAAAGRVVVVADHTKWALVGLARISGWDRVDALVTDAALPADAQPILAERVGSLLLADGEPHAGRAG